MCVFIFLIKLTGWPPIGKIVGKLYFPFSENKGAEQLCSYCTTDLRLCFRIDNNPVFSQYSSNGK